MMKGKLVATRQIGSLVIACGLAASSGLCLAEPSAATPSNPFAAYQVIPSQELATRRGRGGDLTIVSSHQKFEATVQGIQFNVGAINTGTITVGEKAFAGFDGVAALTVLNSGNANSITAGMNVTINLY